MNFIAWVQGVEAMLPMAGAIASVVILAGCAAACWRCPSKQTDEVFHRHVM